MTVTGYPLALLVALLTTAVIIAAGWALSAVLVAEYVA